MKPTSILALAAAALALLACSTVPMTGRSQLTLISVEQETQMGLDAWGEIIRKAKVVQGTPEADMVERVGRRIAQASGESYAWEFRLLDDDQINAFCLPGGKVAVYRGLLPVTQTEDGLAAVIGHEVAHATSHHGRERVSQQLITQGVLGAAEVGLKGQDPLVREAALKGLGLGAQVGALLPYSRLHEHEADEVGLRYMVRAGYDPYEAVRVWQRMAKVGEKRPPEFLSTHPEPESRAARLYGLIPQIVAEERGR